METKICSRCKVTRLKTVAYTPSQVNSPSGRCRVCIRDQNTVYRCVKLGVTKQMDARLASLAHLYKETGDFSFTVPAALVDPVSCTPAHPRLLPLLDSNAHYLAALNDKPVTVVPQVEPVLPRSAAGIDAIEEALAYGRAFRVELEKTRQERDTLRERLDAVQLELAAVQGEVRTLTEELTTARNDVATLEKLIEDEAAARVERVVPTPEQAAELAEMRTLAQTCGEALAS
jgi:hypothetical protein